MSLSAEIRSNSRACSRLLNFPETTERMVQAEFCVAQEGPQGGQALHHTKAGRGYVLD